MRKIFFLLALGTLAACNSSTDESKVDSMSASADSAKQDNITYPYTAEYSSKFEIGDPKLSGTLLGLYKDWDNNTLDNSKSHFADSVTMHFADGSQIQGNRDTVLATAKKFRGTLGSVTSVLDVWIPLKSTDKNENWVCTWFKEVRSANDGKKDSSYYQECWRFNSAGQVDRMEQFEQKFAPPKK